MTVILVILLAIGLLGEPPRHALVSAQAPARTTVSPWAPFVEPDFPFFSSVLDARGLGEGWPVDNLTPRGLILNLGHGLWACFDTDLLRVAAIWNGAGVTPVGMAQGSYHAAGAKAPEGQGTLPKIAGALWIANGLYPGWQAGDGRDVSLADPRPAGPDPNELARGPLDPALGRFRGVRLTADGAVLEYDVHGASIQEQIVARGDGRHGVVERRFRVEGAAAPLRLVVGRRAGSAPPLHAAMVAEGRAVPLTPRPTDGLIAATVPASSSPREFRVEITLGQSPAPSPVQRPDAAARAMPPPARWPQVVATRASLSASSAFVVDRIGLPTDNPWRRNVRLADIGFLGGGRAAAVTFDGDVWMIDGLTGDLPRVTWRRFASGLHEPLGLAIRSGELFVFDRHGLWRLRDADGNGEADRYEMFSNAFVQSAETREFAMSLRAAPDGSFVIAKGGQAGKTVGRDNGSVLRVSADGRTVTRLGYGLRQPFASVDPRTGLVIASDQQGNYVPSTPLHEIRDGQYYGFLPSFLPKEQYPAPIAEPITWIPHSISAAAAGQVWLSGARMGPLNDALILIGYYRPEVFLVRIDHRARPFRAAVASLTNDFDFAPLAGGVNPADGQLYVAGFRIWGTEARDISGLARIRYTGAPTTLPRDVTPAREGVLLRFDVALDRRAAADPANYSAERWNYRRSAEYGSPHLSLQYLTKGQDAMMPSSAYVSRDGKAVFIGLPDMQTVMQMRLGWTLKTQSGTAFDQSTYFTAHTLPRFDPAAEGFDATTVSLTPRASRAAGAIPVTAEAGQRIAARMGCLGCHSADGTVVGRVGPSWKGLYGANVSFTDRTRATADAAYLRQSILEPSARVVAGFDQSDAGMPSYAGVLTPAEIDALILYIQSLK